MLYLRDTWGVGEGICDVRYPAVYSSMCLLAAVLCESPAVVCPFPVSAAGGIFLWVVCALSPS